MDKSPGSVAFTGIISTLSLSGNGRFGTGAKSVYLAVGLI